MKGTEKQIKWAREIRTRKTIEMIDGLEEEVKLWRKDGVPEADIADAKAQFEAQINLVKEKDSAKWWIENRNTWWFYLASPRK